jgi:hypothetical protein
VSSANNSTLMSTEVLVLDESSVNASLELNSGAAFAEPFVQSTLMNCQSCNPFEHACLLVSGGRWFHFCISKNHFEFRVPRPLEIHTCHSRVFEEPSVKFSSYG